MRHLIDAMQSNFNTVCNQLREAQAFYDAAEGCIHAREDELEQIRVQKMSRPVDEFSSEEEEGVAELK